MVEIKEYNTQILALLKRKELQRAPGILLCDIPIQFPIDTQEQLEILENYIKEEDKLNALVSRNYLWFLNILPNFLF